MACAGCRPRKRRRLAAHLFLCDLELLAEGLQYEGDVLRIFDGRTSASEIPVFSHATIVPDLPRQRLTVDSMLIRQRTTLSGLSHPVAAASFCLKPSFSRPVITSERRLSARAS
jgi:hypothetical protein